MNKYITTLLGIMNIGAGFIQYTEGDIVGTALLEGTGTVLASLGINEFYQDYKQNKI